MGRKPIRLEKALSCLSDSADRDGFVRDPSQILHSAGFADAAPLIRKLGKLGKIKIFESGHCRRIDLIQLLSGVRGEVSVTTSSEKSGTTSPPVSYRLIKRTYFEKSMAPSAQFPATAEARAIDLHAIENNESSAVKKPPSMEWKNAPSRHIQMFEFLQMRAKELGTYPRIEDPMMLMQKNGFKPPALYQYMKRLRDLDLVETILGEGRSGRGIAALIVKERPAHSAPEQPPASKRAGRTGSATADRVLRAIDAPDSAKEEKSGSFQQLRPSNRAIVFVDLENFVLRLKEKDREVDIQKIENLCRNYGTCKDIRYFVSEETYHNSEAIFSRIINGGIPLTIVKNGKDSVDMAIARAIGIALEHDYAETFILGTHDDGAPYQEIADRIKEYHS